MSTPNSEHLHASRYDDKSQGKGDDAAVVSTMSHGGASPSIEGEGFPADVDEKKLMRKIDFRLIPWLSVLYLLSFLDRASIGNARLYGLEKELNLTSTQYGLALTVFFFPYALFEVPSNVLLKRLRPSIWFPLITALVGICMLSQGLVHNYAGLLVARFFLGVTEAGLFPGVNFTSVVGTSAPSSVLGLRSSSPPQLYPVPLVVSSLRAQQDGWRRQLQRLALDLRHHWDSHLLRRCGELLAL